jgi:hypothetical protein
MSDNKLIEGVESMGVKDAGDDNKVCFAHQ